MAEKLAPHQRIVITGMGTVGPNGLNVKDSWEATVAGKSGIALIEPEENRDCEVWIGGQVKGFDLTNEFSTKELRRIHPNAQFSYAASLEALIDAGLWVDNKLRDVDPERFGLRIGSGVGGSTYIAKVQDIILEDARRNSSKSRIPPFAILQTLIERGDSVVSIRFGIKGDIAATVAACASASICITDAIKTMREDDADIMLAGAGESAIDKIGLGSFRAVNALSTRNNSPQEASRPFDKDVDGFVMSEGAGIIVLERLDHALARGAKIRAEIIGYGNSGDASHDTAPSGEGAVRAMRRALNKARIDPEEIDYINAHATSTPLGDGVELDAIMEVSGGKYDRVSVSSTKSTVGHLMGAAAVYEVIMCIKALETGIIPPTINLRNPIREGLDLVPNEARIKPVDIALSNSFGFGGFNSVLAIGKYAA